MPDIPCRMARHAELAAAMDEAAFEIAELLWAEKRGIAAGYQYAELADQLRALAERLSTHGGAG